jgi:hypothetical protein
MTNTFTLEGIPVTSELAQQALTDRFNGLFNPLEISAEAFQAAYDTPEIGPHIEKDYKGLSYLSWPFAYRYLKQHFPTFFVAFEEKSVGEVAFGTPGAYYLRPYLTDGSRRTVALVFPIMDRRHNAIKELDGRAISDNCQRAAVKCIATFTGLGLRLYAGEDIPKEEEQRESSKPAPAAKKAAPSSKAATGGTSKEAAPAFDGKAALMSFCSANPLGYANEKACQLAIKGSLETLGLARGSDVKNCADFTNVVSTLMASWTKDNGIKITKADMAQELAKITAEAKNGVDAVNNAVAAFYAAKK